VNPGISVEHQSSVYASSSLVNCQRDMPNIAVRGARVSVRLDGRKPRHLRLLPEGAEWPYAIEGHRLSFEAPELETLLMFSIEWSESR